MKQVRKRMALLVVIALLITTIVPMAAFAADEQYTLTPAEQSVIAGGANPANLTADFDAQASGNEVVWTVATSRGGAQTVIEGAGGATPAGATLNCVTVFSTSVVENTLKDSGSDTVYIVAYLVESGESANFDPADEDTFLARTEAATIKLLPNYTPTFAEANVDPEQESFAIGSDVEVTITPDLNSAATDAEYSLASENVWQISMDEGKTWSEIDSYTTGSYTYMGYAKETLVIQDVAYAQNGFQYRLVATVLDKDGEIVDEFASDAWTLVVEPAAGPTADQLTPTITEIKGEATPDTGDATTIVAGDSITMTAVLDENDDTTAISYQWQKQNADSEWEDIVGATDATYTIDAAAEEDAGEYRCYVENVYEGEIYVGDGAATFTLTVEEQSANVQILVQPEEQKEAAKPGDTVTYTVEARITNGDPIAYQWQYSLGGTSAADWKNIDGATTDTLTLENVTTEMNNYKYQCVITNATVLKPWETPGASDITEPVTLKVEAEEVVEPSHEITLVDEDASWNETIDVVSGTIPTLEVNATTEAGDTLSYQWSITGGNDLAGATSSTYTLPAAVTTEGTYRYTCTVTNEDVEGESATYNVTLNVQDATKFATIEDLTIDGNTEINIDDTEDVTHLQVIATAPKDAEGNDQTLVYNWQVKDLSDEDGNFTPVVSDNDEDWITVDKDIAGVYEYKCVVTVDGAAKGEQVESDVVRVVVYEAGVPFILGNLPTTAEANVGGTYTFTVDAQVNPDFELVYRWSKDGEVVYEAMGEAGATYTTPVFTEEDLGLAEYTCKVINAAYYSTTNDKYAEDSFLCTLTVKEGEAVVPELSPVDGIAIEDGFVTGATAAKDATTAADVKAMFEAPAAGEIVVKSAAGEILADDAAAGTGCTIELVANGAVIESVTLVLAGDVNGDGAAGIGDMVLINQAMRDASALEGARAAAADVNGDGSFGIGDMVLVNNAMRG